MGFPQLTKPFAPGSRPAMDGLRGIACLSVVIIHSIALTVPESYEYLRGTAKIGVWLFFALSAFLLTTGLINERFTARTVVWYAWHRFIKIFPPLAICLWIYWALQIPGSEAAETIWNTLLLREGVNHFWTIPVEVKVYFVLPLAVAGLMVPWRLWGAGVALLAAIIALFGWAYVFPPYLTPENSLSPKWYALAFGAGTVGAWVAKKFRFRPRPTDFWIAAGSVVAYTFAVKVGLGSNPVDGLMDKHYIFGALWSLVILCAYHSPPDFLRWRLLGIVGRASFSIYLWHWAAIEMLKPHFSAPTAIPLAVALSVAIGSVAYLLVEWPLEALRRRPKPDARQSPAFRSSSPAGSNA